MNGNLSSDITTSVTFNHISCGFGGCAAPEPPRPVWAPSDVPLPEQDDTLVPGGFAYHLGFGGCRTPEAPRPLWTPGSSSFDKEGAGSNSGIFYDLGFGGCSAPQKPRPVWMPGSAAALELWS